MNMLKKSMMLSCYEIKTNDVMKVFTKISIFFYLSNYPKDLKVFDPDNEKVIGKMKDESKGEINDELVGLKLKMHSIKYVDGKEMKRGKGINQNVVKNKKHEEYITVFFIKTVVRHNMKRIQSKLHISLSCFDDKRHMLDDGINTLAYFHKDTRSQ